MFVSITEKASTFPISTSAMMEYLRAPAEDEALVKRLIPRAFAAFTKFTNGHVGAPTTYSVWLDRSEIGLEAIRLPVQPIFTDINEAIAYDSDGNEIEVAAIGLVGDRFALLLEEIPSSARDHRTVEISVQAGYSDDTIPDDILAGVEQFVVHLYERRGDQDVDIPDAVARLWAPYVFHRLGG